MPDMNYFELGKINNLMLKFFNHIQFCVLDRKSRRALVEKKNSVSGLTSILIQWILLQCYIVLQMALH